MKYSTWVAFLVSTMSIRLSAYSPFRHALRILRHPFPPETLTSNKWYVRRFLSENRDILCDSDDDTNIDGTPFYPDNTFIDRLTLPAIPKEYEQGDDNSSLVENVWMIPTVMGKEGTDAAATVSSPDSFVSSRNTWSEDVSSSNTMSSHRQTIKTRGFSTLSRVRRFFSTSTRRHASSPYALFGLPPNASAAQIKAKYYDLVKQLHPDRAIHTTDSKEEQLKKFREVVEAYNLLKDPKKRALYDKFGIGWGDEPSFANSPWGTPVHKHPRTEEEWAQWHMWSEVLRRMALRGEAAAWQRRAQNPYTSNNFYGFPNVSPEEAKRSSKEVEPINLQVLGIIFIIASILAFFHIEQARQFSQHDSELSSRYSRQVAWNLEQARESARSDEGILRQRMMLERAREAKRNREGLSTEDL